MQRHTRITGSSAKREGAWCALLLLAALLAGCGTATAQKAGPTATATWQIPTTAPVTPTATVAPPITSGALTWRHTTLPNGFGRMFHSSDAEFAPSDGATAYACNGASATGQLQVLVTYDRGRTWGTLRTLSGLRECDAITVDDVNPNIAIVHQSFLQNVDVSYLTTDGGQTWNQTPNTASLVIEEMATVGGRTYAIIGSNNSSGQLVQHVSQSDDGMRTWHAIDTALVSALNPAISQNYLSSLWVNPASGALLVSAQISGGGFEIWSSGNDGATWTQLKPPSSDGDLFNVTVQQPFAAQPWHICYQDIRLNSVICTTDGGASWNAAPQFWAGGGSSDVLNPVGLPGDGSLLITLGKGGSVYKLYRLPAHSAQWQDVGQIAPPAGGTSFAPNAGGSGGTLWQMPAESDGAGAPDPANDIYTAIYPY